MSAKLNTRQLAFCREYIVDFNATQSAIRAGYAEKSARTTASRLLTNDDIQEKIREMIRERNERTMVTADRVVMEFAKIAFSNIHDVATWPDGGSYVRLKPPDEVDGAIVAEVSNTEAGVKVKLHDKMKALEALAKHTGVYDEQVNTTINISPFVEALKQSGGDIWDDEEENDGD